MLEVIGSLYVGILYEVLNLSRSFSVSVNRQWLDISWHMRRGRRVSKLVGWGGARDTEILILPTLWGVHLEAMYLCVGVG